MANLYNSEGYFSPTEYEAMTRIEKEEKAARKAANFRPIHLLAIRREHRAEHRERKKIQPFCGGQPLPAYHTSHLLYAVYER